MPTNDLQGPGGHIPPLAAVVELDFAPVIGQVERLVADFDDLALSASSFLGSIRAANVELATTVALTGQIGFPGGASGGGGGVFAPSYTGGYGGGASAFAAGGSAGRFRDTDDVPFAQSFASEFLGELTNRIIPVTAVGLYASGQSGRLASDIEFVKNLDFGGVSVDTILKTYAAGRYLTAPLYRGLGSAIGNPILRGAGAFGIGLAGADVGIEIAEALLTGQPIGEALGEATTIAPLLSFGAGLRRDLAKDITKPSDGYRFGDGVRNLYRLWNRRRGYRAPGIDGYEDLGLPDHYWEDLYDDGDGAGLLDFLVPSASAAVAPPVGGGAGLGTPPTPPPPPPTAGEVFSRRGIRDTASRARSYVGDLLGGLPADEAASLGIRAYTTFAPGTLGRLHGRTLQASDALVSVGLNREAGIVRYQGGGFLSGVIDELPDFWDRMEERAASAETRFRGLAQASDHFARQASAGLVTVVGDFTKLDDVAKNLLTTIANMIIYVSILRPFEQAVGNLFSTGAGAVLPGLVGVPDTPSGSGAAPATTAVPGSGNNIVINNRYEGVSNSQAIELAATSRAQSVDDISRAQFQITSEFYTGRI